MLKIRQKYGRTMSLDMNDIQSYRAHLNRASLAFKEIPIPRHYIYSTWLSSPLEEPIIISDQAKLTPATQFETQK